MATNQAFTQYVQEWDREASLLFGKEQSVLLPTIAGENIKSTSRTDTYTFRNFGNISATNKLAYGQENNLHNPTRPSYTAQIEKYGDALAFDEQWEELTNISNTVSINYKNLMNAHNNEIDRLITVDALIPTNETAIPDNGTGMTVQKLKILSQRFNENNVPEDMRFIVMNEISARQLMEDDEYINAYFTNNWVLEQGKLKPFMGITPIVISTGSVGYALPDAGNLSTSFGYSGHALGFVSGYFLMSSRQSVNPASQLIQQLQFNIATTKIQDYGIVPILTDNTI